jgi:DNA-binding NarL/FixJ family response regulator
MHEQGENRMEVNSLTSPLYQSIIAVMDKTRVLLADDHAIVRAGIGKALGELDGLEIVEEVGDGPSLFDALARLRPDLLVMDVAMPNFSPLADVKRIRNAHPSLKILVVSAYDDDAYVVGLLDAGVDGYHLKDQPLSDLRLAVQRVLAGERWLSSPLVNKLLHPRKYAPSLPLLTPRQCDLLRMLQQGLDNAAIARAINLSVKTVENHLTRLYRQLGVSSRLEAMAYVVAHPEVLAVAGKAAQADRALPVKDISLCVLLVDDNARYRGQLRRMMGKACAQSLIYEADSVKEALRLVRQHPIQLALVDVVLGPDVESGIQCARRLRALDPQMRVVLISAYPDREFHRQGLEAGAVAFLDKKDLDVATLRQVVDDIIASSVP